MMQQDTETLIALVSSLLPKDVSMPDTAKVLETLVNCDGDVQAAVDKLVRSKLLGVGRNRGSRKRKRAADLSEWLQEPARNAPRTEHRVDPEKFCGTDERIAPVEPGPRATTSASASKTKPPVDLMSVLCQPRSLGPVIPRLPPLTLTTPSLVASHIPCTLHHSILPPELACRLFYEMLDASREWKRNKWWLFERMVESPHRTFFYSRAGEHTANGAQEAAQYWYNGRATSPPPSFSSAMEEACAIIEQTVNTELSKRDRFPLEYPGNTWQANVAAANCYEGMKEGVGAHSDQLTYLGPYPTIASLSLGTQRVFRLREVVPVEEANTRHARTYNVPLPHNSLTIMHASCQERYKHSIPPQSTLDLFHPPFPRSSSSSSTHATNVRINLTFRFYRPDFHPSTIPRCHCGVPTILRHDMKRREGRDNRYWWVCFAGAQREGKGCKFWKEMDMLREGRGGVSRSLSCSDIPVPN